MQFASTISKLYSWHILLWTRRKKVKWKVKSTHMNTTFTWFNNVPTFIELQKILFSIQVQCSAILFYLAVSVFNLASVCCSAVQNTIHVFICVWQNPREWIIRLFAWATIEQYQVSLSDVSLDSTVEWVLSKLCLKFTQVKCQANFLFVFSQVTKPYSTKSNIFRHLKYKGVSEIQSLG